MKFTGYAYSLDEIERMLIATKGVARVARISPRILYSFSVAPKAIAAIPSPFRYRNYATVICPNLAEESRDALRQIEDAFPFGL